MCIATSIVIRTYNEANYLDEVLCSIKAQELNGMSLEIVLVDSGSTDQTLEIAQRHNCRIKKINKTEFTFGYSLNIGCEAANGDYLIFISGHCVPVNEKWMQSLLEPLMSGAADYCYGGQVGRDTTKFSENIHLEKTFPRYNKLPQNGFFCNNANAAITKKCWEQYRFDESLTGLEDMHLAKQLIEDGRKIGYIANAAVYHIHDETWDQIFTRYEREAYALQKIAPELHFTRKDFFRYFFSGLFADLSKAVEKKCVIGNLIEIIKFRLYMYLGTYRGSKEHRQLSEKMKKAYFYPKDIENKQYEKAQIRCSSTYEGKQPES